MTQLIKYETARRALSEAVMFDEVMTIMNVAEQAALYAKQANDNELVEKATEIRVRAQRKAGEMLRKAAERGQRATVATGVERGANRHSSQPATSVPTLAEIGVTKSESSRYQQLAAMPDDHFETAVATAKATAGEVTTAFMLREAAKTKPPKRLNKKEQERLQEMQEAKARGVSMLTTYARLTLTALRASDSFDRTERELLAELADAIQEVSESV